MPEPTFSTIAPLVQDLDVRGRSVSLKFRCPRSGQSVQARYTLTASATTAMTSRVGQSISRSLMYSLRSAVFSVVRGIFGHGIVGRVASDLAYSAVNEAQRSTSQRQQGLSRAEQEQAIVAAFVSVQQHFVWDPDAGTWVSAKAAHELMSPFQRQLSEHPIMHPYDRQVLARMLVEVARSDGRVSNEESGWLTEMLGPDQGSLSDVASRPPLSASELGACSPGGVRVSLLLLAWALALVDEELAGREQELLQRFGQGLDLRPPQLSWARDTARGWVLDQALDRMATWGGHDQHAREQLYALAGRLGMSQREAEDAEARFLRRQAR